MPSTAVEFTPTVAPPAGVAPPDELHLPGAPVRAAICEVGLFTPTAPPGGGPAISPIYGQLDRRLWQVPGTYCLLWSPQTTNPTDMYVGSCNDFYDRLIGHDQTGWTHAILLTGHGVGQAAAEQAESALGRVLSAAKPLGRLTKHWTKHPSPWGADVPWHLLEPLVVLLDECLDKVGVDVSLDPRQARRL